MSGQQRITIVCGHYGCGKTNLALNLALEEAPCTLADLDVVNPYFRSSEYEALLEQNGVRLIKPVFAGTTLDTPTLSPALFSLFDDAAGRVLIDAGGDDAGVTALGGLSTQLTACGYEMIYVINQNRVLSQTPEEAAGLLKEIEAASRLKATGIVNNTHLGVETDLETLLEGLPFAQKTAELCGLPLLYSTAPDFALSAGERLPQGFRLIRRLVKFCWEPPSGEQAEKSEDANSL